MTFVIVVVVVAVLLILFAFAALRVAREYERGIVFILGRLLEEPKGPGLFLLIPIVFPAPIDLIQPLLERTAQPTHSAQ